MSIGSSKILSGSFVCLLNLSTRGPPPHKLNIRDFPTVSLSVSPQKALRLPLICASLSKKLFAHPYSFVFYWVYNYLINECSMYLQHFVAITSILLKVVMALSLQFQKDNYRTSEESRRQFDSQIKCMHGANESKKPSNLCSSFTLWKHFSRLGKWIGFRWISILLCTKIGRQTSIGHDLCEEQQNNQKTCSHCFSYDFKQLFIFINPLMNADISFW